MSGRARTYGKPRPPASGEQKGAAKPLTTLARKRRGIALLLVLWLLVLLSVMAVSFSGTARTQARIARNLHDNMQARWMADAGVRLAVRNLWLGGRGNVPASGQMHFCTFQSGVLAVWVQNVSGLIDLNAAPVSSLQNLFAAVGVAGDDARRLAAAVADFRDRNDEPEPEGAETEAYARAELAHGPKNSAFQAVEELEQVLGMPPGLFERIRPAVTVYSRRPTPDLRLAPPLVRSAYGEDGASFQTRPSATAGSRSSQGIFAITVTSKTASGAHFVRDSVLAVNGPPLFSYKILRWIQGAEAAEISFPDAQALPPC